MAPSLMLRPGASSMGVDKGSNQLFATGDGLPTNIKLYLAYQSMQQLEELLADLVTSLSQATGKITSPDLKDRNAVSGPQGRSRAHTTAREVAKADLRKQAQTEISKISGEILKAHKASVSIVGEASTSIPFIPSIPLITIRNGIHSH